MLQNIIVISINLADNVMLGGYSELALSGAAAVNQIQFVYQQLLTAAGEGVVIIGSQYLGKGQTAPMKQIAAIALKTGLLIGAVLFALVSCLPSGLKVNRNSSAQAEAFTAEAVKTRKSGQEGICPSPQATLNGQIP